MKELRENEKGITLIELLAGVMLLTLVGSLLMGVLDGVNKIHTSQSQRVEYQQVANSIYAHMNYIAKIDGLAEKAGYKGKFDSPSAWAESHIVKVLEVPQGKGSSDSPETFSEIGLAADGSNRIALTDILDTMNERNRVYSLTNKKQKIKVIQQKNKNEATNTIYGTPNYRDTFTIQMSVLILFYEGDISFSSYYDGSQQEWDIETLKSLNNVKYTREFEITYRDEEKAEGGVPGDGRW